VIDPLEKRLLERLTLDGNICDLSAETGIPIPVVRDVMRTLLQKGWAKPIPTDDGAGTGYLAEHGTFSDTDQLLSLWFRATARGLNAL
jgi:hypothetical protein